MTRLTYGDLEYSGKRKCTRREIFMAEIEQVVPLQELLALIDPHYPRAGRGRRPCPLTSMLRIHLVQNWLV
jgi:IS5 family transposase